MGGGESCSVEHAGLVGGHHVLYVNEGVLAPVALKHLQGLLDQVTNVFPLLLAVVDAVPRVDWTGGEKGGQTDMQGLANTNTERQVPSQAGGQTAHTHTLYYI